MSELFPAFALIKLLGLLSGRKPHRLAASFGADAAPRPDQAPFLKKSRLERQFVVTVAVAIRLDQRQMQDGGRHRHSPMALVLDRLTTDRSHLIAGFAFSLIPVVLEPDHLKRTTRIVITPQMSRPISV